MDSLNKKYLQDLLESRRSRLCRDRKYINDKPKLRRRRSKGAILKDINNELDLIRDIKKDLKRC